MLCGVGSGLAGSVAGGVCGGGREVRLQRNYASHAVRRSHCCISTAFDEDVVFPEPDGPEAGLSTDALQPPLAHPGTARFSFDLLVLSLVAVLVALVLDASTDLDGVLAS